MFTIEDVQDAASLNGGRELTEHEVAHAVAIMKSLRTLPNKVDEEGNPAPEVSPAQLATIVRAMSAWEITSIENLKSRLKVNDNSYLFRLADRINQERRRLGMETMAGQMPTEAQQSLLKAFIELAKQEGHTQLATTWQVNTPFDGAAFSKAIEHGKFVFGVTDVREVWDRLNDRVDELTELSTSVIKSATDPEDDPF